MRIVAAAWRTWLTIVVAVASGLPAAGSGSATGSNPKNPQAVFRSHTTQVVLDVVVTGKGDRLIEDLTADDFEVVQAGRKQIVNQFDFIKVPLGNRELPSTAAPLDDLPPATNRKPPRESRIFAIVIDDGTMLPPDIVATKLLVRQFVQRAQPDDMMSLTYVNRSDLSQDFTRDSGRIIRSADRVAAALGAGPANGEPLTGSVRRADTLATLKVLSNVIKVLSAAREPRRAILMVGRGTYLKKGSYWPEWSQLYREANQAGVPIYSLHSGGLSAPELGLDLPLELQTPDQIRIMNKNMSAGVTTLQEIASNTGGRAYVNRANIVAAVDEMLMENGSYYVLGFEPSPYSTKKFQEVRVTVRRPGASVHARKGYVSKPSADAAEDDVLTIGLGEGTPGGDLPLSGILTRTAPDGDVVVAVDIEPSQVAALRDQVKFEWLALDAEARITGRGTAQLKVPAETSKGERGIVIVARLTVSPGTRVVRVGVSSAAGRSSGWIHLQVEPLRSRGEGVSASTVLLTSKHSDAPALAVVGDVRAVLPFTPSSRRTFSSTETLGLFCRLIGLPNGTPVQARLLRVTDQQEVLTIKTSINMSGSAADATADIPLASLAPGNYRVEVLAGAEGGRVRRATLITVR